MEANQEREWVEAQKIELSEDLISVAKQQLLFLAAVDRNRYLYGGPTLHRAIYRYNACWIPLLAKHSNSKMSKGPLVVPLDCEWIWHCHRLNPVQYKSDCERIYGRILDAYNVVSSIHGTSTEETAETWKKLYPEEPYHFDYTVASLEDVSKDISADNMVIKYDLEAAVKRQSPFFYQMSRHHMSDDLFLEGAVSRYRGFLYLIKKNKENSLRRFCVPTYDIDLIWHSHQINPVSYCKDLTKILGKVLEHDDMDSDRTKGKKLDLGFFETTKQWEDTFGLRYWRAGAMYRGTAPSPLTVVPCVPEISRKVAKEEIYLPGRKFVEVLLEIVGVKNIPEGHKGSLFVSITKKTPDVLFPAKRTLTILPESRNKVVASFQCEPTGELLLELISCSSLPISRCSKSMASSSIPLEDLFTPQSKLQMDKWLELTSNSGDVSCKPICLHVAVSVTAPMLAEYEFEMVRPRQFLKGSCFFPLAGNVQHAKNWTSVIDESGTEVISLQLRDSKTNKASGGTEFASSKEVLGIKKSGETCTLAEFVGNGWSLMDPHWSLKPQPNSSEGHIFYLTGSRMVKLFPGRRLKYEHKCCDKRKNEQFITAVEFSAEYPYGKAVALIDLKLGFLKVSEGWFVLPGITVAFILSDGMRKEGYNGFVTAHQNMKEEVESKGINRITPVKSKMELMAGVPETTAAVVGESRSCRQACGGACGTKCDDAVNAVGSGGCGSGCGGGCGNVITVGSGGCGSGCGGGCGSGCGNVITVGSGGCGSGCGGGCGSGCGGGCGNVVRSGGGACSSSCAGCGSGCGNMVKSGGDYGKHSQEQ